MAARILLMRHGRVRGWQTRRYLGRTDVSLDGHGRDQARWWAKRLSGGLFGNPSRVWCSGLWRSRETAELVAAPSSGPGLEPGVVPSVEPMVVPELNEIDLGDWDGLPMAEVRRDHPELYQARGRDLPGFRPPNGESFADLAARAVPAFMELAEQVGDGETALVVGHAGVNRVVLCHLLNMPLSGLFSLAQDHAGLNVIRIGPRGPVLECLNLTPDALDGLHAFSG